MVPIIENQSVNGTFLHCENPIDVGGHISVCRHAVSKFLFLCHKVVNSCSCAMGVAMRLLCTYQVVHTWPPY